jgi:hypothetical protein
VHIESERESEQQRERERREGGIEREGWRERDLIYFRLALLSPSISSSLPSFLSSSAV